MKPKTEIKIKDGKLYLTVSYPPTGPHGPSYSFFNSDAGRIALEADKNIVANIQGGTLRSDPVEPRQHTWIYILEEETMPAPQKKSIEKTAKKTIEKITNKIKKKTTNKTKKKGD